MTDAQGLLLAVYVHSAGMQDREGADEAVRRAKTKWPSLLRLLVDRGYEGTCCAQLAATHKLDVEVSRPREAERIWNHERWTPWPPLPLFSVQRMRWVVERTNAWTDRLRRLAKDYDLLVKVSEAWIWFAHAMFLLRRLVAVF